VGTDVKTREVVEEDEAGKRDVGEWQKPEGR